MKRLTNSEKKSAHRIINHVNDIVGNYYGYKTLEEAVNFVSQNKWIMFSHRKVSSLREGTSLPIPNIYVSFHEDIIDDGNGRACACIGVTYNNAESMNWLNNILKNRKNSSFFIGSINSLDHRWGVYIQQKIKTGHKDNTPKWFTKDKFEAKTVKAEDIREAIKKSDANLLTNKDNYEGEPILWSTTTFNVCIEVHSNYFDRNIEVAFDLLLKAISLR